MPTFPAPAPVVLVVDVPVAALHVVAGERDDVVVTVLPADPSSSGSRRAAAEVRVQHDDGTVTVDWPGAWKQYLLPFSAGTAAVTVELPEGSDVRGKAGTVLTEGRLGAVELALSAGDARVDEAHRVDLRAAAGTVVVRRVTGPVAVRASAGSVRLADVAGEGTVRASNGTTTVDAVTGTLHVVGAHGDIAVGRVTGTLTARSAHAGIRVERVESGSVDLSTSYGSIEVGVPHGTAAWLDVASQHGAVRNQLTPAGGPVEDEATAEVRASTGYGDVVVRRP